MDGGDRARMTKRSATFSEIPVDLVGGNEFGRYPKISNCSTWNMLVSDGFLVPFAGHKKVLSIDPVGESRGIFNSQKLGSMVVVINDGVFVIDNRLNSMQVATLNTSAGDVYIDENDKNQIAICDQKNIYIYNTSTGAFTQVDNSVTGFTPGYISFHDTRFIAAASGSATWRLSDPGNGTSWPTGAQNVGVFQTKPDNVNAVVRLPGKGNQILVVGNIVTESWQDVGAQLFPYQRSTGFNIDYGVLNPSTIASGDTFVIWLAKNEKSGPVIMYTQGGGTEQISNDGINFKLAQLANPEKSYAYLFKQDGHLIYVISFIDPRDNFTLAYDFTNQKFVSLSDEYMNHHIAKKVVFFNNTYYFISFTDGNLYELNSKYTTFNGAEIPRIRITSNMRAKDASPFIADNLTFTMEQGVNSEDPIIREVNVIDKGNIGVSSDFPTLATVQIGWLYHITQTVFDDDVTKTNTGLSFAAGSTIHWDGFTWNNLQDNVSRVDLSISVDGGETFGKEVGQEMNQEGNRKNRIIFWSLGWMNDLVCKFRFSSLGRIVATDGILSIYQ